MGLDEALWDILEDGDCNALVSILLFLVALNILFEFLNDHVDM